jgi:hypothetical protein
MRRIVLAALAIAVACGATAYFSYQPHKQVSAPSVQTASVAQALPQIDHSKVALTKPYSKPALTKPNSKVALTKSYSNDQYKFSLHMPDNFAAWQLPADDSGATTILLQNEDKTDGVQIIVTPFSEDLHTLTADRIHQEIPDMKISEPQPVQIGDNYTGLAFKSDNEEFNGASREVWFVFRGNLYQISTYDRLDPLLKSIFGTWTF